MIDFEDVIKVNLLLQDAQAAESDNREKVREAHHFLDKRDGQWEPDIINRMQSRPRYTFDKCNPIVDDIAGEMEGADFDIRVRPSGGQATKDMAKTIDGIIRNIENMSNATQIFNAAGREMVAGGLAGWEVAQDWVDADSFDQDLMIKPISNYEDRVWFINGGERQDQSDAPGVFVLQNLTPDEYETRFPDGSKQSIGSQKTFDAYTHKPEFITVGRILYKEKVVKELALMTNGAVYEMDDNFKRVEDELAAQGITVERTRKKDSVKVVSRLFDGGEWLTEKEDTVFQWLPIIPTYGNFKIRESKIIYRGAIDKLMDAQRVYNYARSREVEEVALAPRAKYWMTRKQAENGDDRLKLSTLNTNSDPVQFYTADEKNPGPPQQIGGAAPNPGLLTTVQNSLSDIGTSAGRLSVQGGDTDGPLSGVAIQKLQNKGDNSTIKYFKAQEVAICHTARILVDALPRVYDTRREIRVLGEDESFEMVTLNEQVYDTQTDAMVTINDTTKGKYDVTCDVGPAFKNRQQEAVKALQELSQVIPGLAELTADIQLKNIASPGVDLAAERIRTKLFEAGQIPFTQMTKDEQAQFQQSQKQQAQAGKNDPASLIAQAEVEKAQAQTADTISKTRDRDTKSLLEERKQLLGAQDKAEKRDIEELKLLLMQQSQDATQQQATIQANMDAQKTLIDNLNTQAQTLKLLREAMGVDTFAGPHTTEAFVQQAETITDQQDVIQPTIETDFLTAEATKPPTLAEQRRAERESARRNRLEGAGIDMSDNEQ